MIYTTFPSNIAAVITSQNNKYITTSVSAPSSKVIRSILILETQAQNTVLTKDHPKLPGVVLIKHLRKI